MFFNLFSGCPCNKTDAFKHVRITQEGQLFAWYSLPPHHFSARYVKIGEKQCKLQTTTAPLSWNWMGKQKLHAVYSLYVNVKRHASSLIASKLGLVKVYLLLARVTPTRNDNRDSPKIFHLRPVFCITSSSTMIHFIFLPGSLPNFFFYLVGFQSTADDAMYVVLPSTFSSMSFASFHVLNLARLFWQVKTKNEFLFKPKHENDFSFCHHLLPGGMIHWSSDLFRSNASNDIWGMYIDQTVWSDGIFS